MSCRKEVTAPSYKLPRSSGVPCFNCGRLVVVPFGQVLYGGLILCEDCVEKLGTVPIGEEFPIMERGEENMGTFEARIEKLDRGEWREENGHFFIVLKPEHDIVGFIGQLVDCLKRGKIVLRIFPDGKGYVR